MSSPKNLLQLYSPKNLEEILGEIGDYLPAESKEIFDQLKNMKENMEMYSQMMEMMNMMQEEDAQ